MSKASRVRLCSFAVFGAVLAASFQIFGPPDQAAAAAQEAVKKPGLPVATAPADGQMGFVLSGFAPAIYPGLKDNCPNGYTNTISQNFLASLPAAERARLSRPENEKEFAGLWKASARGPNNTNICTNYDQFPERPIQKTLQGKVAFGLDLDGDDGASGQSCGHESFRGPNGERGIDNQAFRALGCTSGWHAPDGSAGDVKTYFDRQLKTGEFTVVLLLRGVDSLVEDNDVEVILASSLDKPVVDAQQNFVSGVTYTVAQNRRWRNVLHGKIRNGVLTADARQVVVSHPNYDGEHGPRLARFEWVFDRSKLRLSLNGDGTLSGVLGGYLPLLDLINRGASSGIGSTDIVNFDCAATYNTLKKLADGGRDPATGQCSKISSAFEVTAVPAYVIDHDDTRVSAR